MRFLDHDSLVINAKDHKGKKELHVLLINNSVADRKTIIINNILDTASKQGMISAELRSLQSAYHLNSSLIILVSFIICRFHRKRTNASKQ